MISTFICLHCGGTYLRNPRVKNQKYCSDKECRRANRRAWKKKNYATNKSYLQKCLDSQKAWRARYPACDYQKQYRKKHPEYVNRCRELQKKRYKKTAYSEHNNRRDTIKQI